MYHFGRIDAVNKCLRDKHDQDFIISIFFRLFCLYLYNIIAFLCYLPISSFYLHLHPTYKMIVKKFGMSVLLNICCRCVIHSLAFYNTFKTKTFRKRIEHSIKKKRLIRVHSHDNCLSSNYSEQMFWFKNVNGLLLL